MHLDVWNGRVQPEHWQTRIDGVELFEPYIQAHQRALYSKIIIADIRDVVDSLENYELIIAGDVIEHLEKADGEAVLEKLYAKATRALIVNIPIGPGWDHPEQHGNPGELHRSQWECSDFIKHPCEIFLARMTCGDYGTFYCSPEIRVADQVESWRMAGQCAESRGDLHEALRCVRHAHQLDPGEAQTVYLLADLSLNHASTGEAISVLRTLLQTRPEYHDARYFLANMLYHTRRPGEASEEVMKLLGIPDLNEELQAKVHTLAAKLRLGGN